MKRRSAMAAALLAMLLAVGIILYPPVSTAYNEAHRSQIRLQHQQEVEQLPDGRIAEMRQKAQWYNQSLSPISDTTYTPQMLEEAAETYKHQLDLVGDGIMGYVEVPKIGAYLPIYHGTGDATLELGVGHLLGSALPIGGEGNHTVLTAHSGKASQKLFSDLPQLETGDRFYLHVLDESLAYEVDAIHQVLPHETQYLAPERQQDYCTLVTCTPFGVNTHRLLVRGSRVPWEQTAEAEPVEPTTEAVASIWEQEYRKGIGYGLLLALTVPGIWCIRCLWRRSRGKA